MTDTTDRAELMQGLAEWLRKAEGLGSLLPPGYNPNWPSEVEACRQRPAAPEAARDFYLGGPYHDGTYSICEVATGRVRHVFNPATDDHHVEGSKYNSRGVNTRDGVQRPAAQAVSAEPMTDEQIASVCLSFRHDFGLLDSTKKMRLMLEAREWERAFFKERATPTGERPAAPADDTSAYGNAPLNERAARTILMLIECLDTIGKSAGETWQKQAARKVVSELRAAPAQAVLPEHEDDYAFMPNFGSSSPAQAAVTDEMIDAGVKAAGMGANYKFPRAVIEAAIRAALLAQPSPPQPSGVDAQWVEEAAKLARRCELAYERDTSYAGDSQSRIDANWSKLVASREALRTHLSTALIGAVKNP